MIQKYSYLIVTILAFWFAWWVLCWILLAAPFGLTHQYDLVVGIIGPAFWVGMAVIPIVFIWLWTRH